MEKDKRNERTVPVFFAADENYMPFLGVTLASLKKHASANRTYSIHVLYTGTLGKNAREIEKMQTENILVCFDDISKQTEKIKTLMHCRDYYTSAIYFRLFIPQLFPKYDKAVYLDCDTVLLEDIAKLYDIPLGDNYIGAVADPVVAGTPAFVHYTENALGIEGKRYFNSGVVVMDLKKLRALDFSRLFSRVLSSYDFVVAPDQDCLNLICKDRVHYFSGAWNVMPLGGKRARAPKLIHYNLSMKPWHYDGVRYEEYFWNTAKETPFYGQITAKKTAFTPEMAARDKEDGSRLLALAQSEADNLNNYARTVGARLKNYERKQNAGGMYGFIGYFSGKNSPVKAD